MDVFIVDTAIQRADWLLSERIKLLANCEEVKDTFYGLNMEQRGFSGTIFEKLQA